MIVVLRDRNLARLHSRIRLFKVLQRLALLAGVASFVLAAFGWHVFPALLGFPQSLVLYCVAWVCITLAYLFGTFWRDTEAGMYSGRPVVGGMWK